MPSGGRLRLCQGEASWNLGSHRDLRFRTSVSGEVTTTLARSWKKGGYLRLECSILMHFGFMIQGGMAGKSGEGLL